MATVLENPLRGAVNSSFSEAARARHPEAPVAKPQHASPSFSQRKALRSQQPDTILVEGNDVMRNIDRPLPGDTVGRSKSQLYPDTSRKRSAYFESEFAGPNRGHDPVDNRIVQDAMVTAELKTNVIIGDEFSFITDLANHLSSRYQRPLSSITVTLQHSLCMLFGGTCDPAYTLTIHALPSLLQPTTNRRNAALIERHLYEALGVISTRGYIRFEAVPKENIAIGGKTLAVETMGAGLDDTDQGAGIFRNPSKSGRAIMKGVKSLGNFRSNSSEDLSRSMPTPPSSNSGETSRIATIPEAPPMPPNDERAGQLEGLKAPKGASRRKSLRFALFGGRTPPNK